MRSLVLFVTLVTVASAVHASQPELRWSCPGASASAPSCPPVVANLHEYPGLESLVVDSETGRVRCVNGQGTMLWEYDGKFAAPLVAAPAVTHAQEPSETLVAVAAGDGVVCGVTASSGHEKWRCEVGPPAPGALLCADLDDDTYDEVIVGTRDAGLVALTAAGETLWQYAQDENGGAVAVTGGLAAADVDADDIPEIFALGRQGPFCLDAEGGLRWRSETAPCTGSAPILADADDDGVCELYFVRAAPLALTALNADSGDELWQYTLPKGDGVARLPAATGAAQADAVPCLAAGDLDNDGTAEILAGSAVHGLHVLSAAGELVWHAAAEAVAPVALSLGDVDADGGIEIVAASADHALYGLDEAGAVEWRYAAGADLRHAPNLADIDGDGNTDILFGAADGTLRCISLGGRYVPRLMPWPMARRTAAQTGFLPGAEALEYEQEEEYLIQESQALLSQGEFEPGKAGQETEDKEIAAKPAGWATEKAGEGTWGLDRETKAVGRASLKAAAGEAPLLLVSEEIVVTPELRTVDASVMAKGSGAAGAAIQWWGRNGVIRKDALRARGADDAGWRRFTSGEVHRPLGARRMAMILETAPSETAWWDQAQITGNFARVPQARVFVNQVGYDVGGPKHFTAWSNFTARDATFSILDKAGGTVHSGRFGVGDRIHGAFGRDWEGYYWQGDFSLYDEEGSFRIQVSMDGATAVSPAFEIGKDLLWDKTFAPACRCFSYHRCGDAVPGYHEACHLDDAVDGQSLAGGWHDGGLYDKRDVAAHVWELARAYGVVQWRLKKMDADSNGRSDILDEAVWGADYLCRAIAADGSAYPPIVSDPAYWGPPERETDNQPGSGDERKTASAGPNDPTLHTAALARLARYVKDNARYIDAAVRGLRWALDHDIRGPLQFSAALDLYLVTRDQTYAKSARELLGDPSLLCTESFVDFEYVVRPSGRSSSEFDTMTSFTLAMMLQEKANEFLEQAENPFGLYAGSAGPGGANFFHTPADESSPVSGNTARILEAANLVAKAYRFHPTPQYRAFICDQLNWIFGNNPYGLCLFEGVGDVGVPTYYHHYANAGVERGAVPGMICNGISGRAPGDDRPYFDMSGLERPNPTTNGFTLRNNALYISTLANLKRIRLHGTKD